MIRPSSSACSASVSLPRFTARAVECSRCSRPRSTASSSMLDADDGEAVAGEHLGDAGAHGAEADDADGAELALYVLVMAAASCHRRSMLRPACRIQSPRRGTVDCSLRETRRCALPGRLRRTADRPPADGHPGADDQGGRVGARALRRRLLQAAELDVAAVHPARGHHRGRRRSSGRRPGPRPTTPCGSCSRRSSTTPATTSASTPACRRTASRSTSRSCSPSTPRRSPPA